MASIVNPSEDAARSARSWRIRAGIAHTFGSLFLLVCVLLLFLGAELLYDAFAHPLTADSGQVIIGSVCLSFSLLLTLFLLHDRSGR